MASNFDFALQYCLDQDYCPSVVPCPGHATGFADVDKENHGFGQPVRRLTRYNHVGHGG